MLSSLQSVLGDNTGKKAEAHGNEITSESNHLSGSNAHAAALSPLALQSELSWDSSGCASASRMAISEMKSAPSTRTVALRAGLVAYGLKAGQVRALALQSSARVLLRGHLAPVYALRFAPQSASASYWLLASAEPAAQRVIVWSIESANETDDGLTYSTVCQFEHDGGLGGDGCALAFSADAQYLMVGSDSGQLFEVNLSQARSSYASCSGPSLSFFDDPSCQCVCRLSSPIKDIAVRSDPPHEASKSSVRRTTAVATEGAGDVLAVPEHKHAFDAEPRQCTHVSWISRESRLACYGKSATVRLQLQSGGRTEEQHLTLCSDPDCATPDVHAIPEQGLVLVSRSDMHVVHLIYASPEGLLQCTQRFTVGGSIHAGDVDLSQDGQHLYVACWQGTSVALLDFPIVPPQSRPSGEFTLTTHTSNAQSDERSREQQRFSPNYASAGSGSMKAQSDISKKDSVGIPDEVYGSGASPSADGSALLAALGGKQKPRIEADGAARGADTNGTNDSSKDAKKHEQSIHEQSPDGPLASSETAATAPSDRDGYAGDAELDDGEDASRGASSGDRMMQKERATQLLGEAKEKEGKNMPKPSSSKEPERSATAAATSAAPSSSIDELERRIQRMMQEQMDALREEREERNRVEHQRHQKLLEAVAQSLRSTLQQHLDEAIKNNVEHIAKAVAAEQQQQMQAVQDNITTQLNNTAEQISKTSTTAVHQAMNAEQKKVNQQKQQNRDSANFEDAVKRAIKEQLLPSLDSTISESMKQMHNSLSRSIDAASSALNRSATGVENASEQCLRTSQQARQLIDASMKQQQEGAAQSQQSHQQSIFDAVMLAVQREDYEQAFSRALMSEDVSIVESLCEQVNPSTVYTPEGSKLPQHVILSLVHYLGTDLTSKSTVRLAWINESCRYVDVHNCSSKLANKVAETLTALRGEMMELQSKCSAEKDASTLRLCRMALQSVDHALFCLKV